MEQASDFLAESEALSALLKGRMEADWNRSTQFKNWTVNDVLVHLYFWNRAADQSLTDPDLFEPFIVEVLDEMQTSTMRAMENARVAERGTDLLNAWQSQYRVMAERWSRLDPKTRVKWAGPEMSVRSSITARQMETWAHGQAVYDAFGIEREPEDRIRNIVVLGVNTFGWSFKVHGFDVPEALPQVQLTAPSGAVWEFGESGNPNRIEGSALEFAQVVAQTRNIADTGLWVDGPVAAKWMESAQCFAGPPETPPQPGSRQVEKCT